MSKKILLVGNISNLAENLFLEAGFNVERIKDASDRDAIIRSLITADAVCGRTAMQLDRGVIENATNLKVIAVFSVNTSGVNVDTAKEKDIEIFSAAGLSAVSVAELTFGLIVALLRKIPQQDSRLKAGKWRKSAANDNAHEVAGKTLGIIGMGDIGQKVAKIARVFDMQVLFFDPFLEKSPSTEFKKVNKEELLKDSDIVTVHAATGDELVGESDIKLMSNSAYLINMARSTTVNASALASALESNQLAGAAIDVHDKERDPFESVFLKEKIKDKVVLTNHSGGETLEARERISKVIARRVIDCLQQ
ncbi:MAG: NAD(P)-dependent oxidoreductase [Candidatus Spechtbacterales bacterium]|nr:NAD(P)-dependent oxidoreductase [Candidatus Spechtbacterales bacterium]